LKRSGPDAHDSVDKTREDLSQQKHVPALIRVLNFIGLALFGIVLVPAAVVRLEQLIVVLPVLVSLIGIYWVFQANPTISSLYLSLSLSLVGWVLICENIISIDNTLGTHVTGNLELGMRLKRLAKNTLKNQNQFRKQCCGDPLSYNYRPGSAYRLTYDCSQCNDPHETTVDSTGYLNRATAQVDSGRPIDIFVAGDSVLQGYGTTSIVELLNDLMPFRIWNLSSTRYGPRQRVHALMTYALPQHPKVIIIDFYSHNDLSDAVMDEVCEETGTYHCLFNVPERKRRLLMNPTFGPMVDASRDILPLFGRLTEESFTLAVTQYIVSNIKGALKMQQAAVAAAADAKRHVEDEYGKTWRVAQDVSRPGGNTDFEVRQEKRSEWMREATQLALRRYDLLAFEIRKMQQPPSVIFLYNPSAYEIYRGVVVYPDENADRASQFQRLALSEYTAKNGWRYLDLTGPLAEEVTRTGVWIYGQNDTTHWSKQGTAVVATVLARELMKMMSGDERTPALPCVQARELSRSSLRKPAVVGGRAGRDEC